MRNSRQVRRIPCSPLLLVLNCLVLTVPYLPCILHSLGDTLFAQTFQNQFNAVRSSSGGDYAFNWEDSPVWNPTEQIQSWFTVRLMFGLHLFTFAVVVMVH